MSDLTFHGIHIDHPGARDRENGKESRVYISLSTPAGRIREIDLTDRDLLLILEQAANRLRTRWRSEIPSAKI